MTITRNVLATTLGLWIVFVTATPAAAQPLTEHVPETAMVYVGWAGAEALADDYADSPLQRVLDETHVQALLTQVLPRLLAEHPAMAAEARELQAVLLEIVPMLWQRPWVLHVDVAGGQPHVSGGALLVDAGDRAGALIDAMERLLEVMGDAGAPVMFVGLDREDTAPGMVALRLGPPPADDAPRLAGHDRFAAAQRQVLDRPAAALYVNLPRVLAMVEAQADFDRGAVEALGLDAVGPVIAAGGFYEAQWRTDVFLGLPADERRGLLSLLDPEPMDESVLDRVPADAMWASVTQFDPAAALEAVRELLRHTDPADADEFDEALMQLSMMLGLDIETDLLAALGSTWVAHHDPRVAGTGALGAVLTNTPRDTAAVERALGQLAQMVNALIQQQQEGAPFNWRLIQQRHGEMTIHSAVLPLVSPSWAVHDGRLYLGLLPQAVMAAVERPERSIRDDPGFRAVRDRLEVDQPLTGLRYVNLPATAAVTYQGYLALSQALPAAAVAFGGDGPASLLPPLHRLQPYLAPAGGAAWSDDAGWHYRHDSPFPGSSMLGRTALANLLNPGVMQAPMLIGTTLPAIGAARSTARGMESASNLRQLLIGVHIYAADSNDELPRTLGDLWPYMGNADVFMHPVAGDPPADIANWPEAQRNAWLDEHSSYVLIVRDDIERIEQLHRPSEKILMFERPEFAHEGRINAGFVDGHVERRDLADIERMIEQQTGQTMQHWIDRQRMPADWG